MRFAGRMRHLPTIALLLVAGCETSLEGDAEAEHGVTHNVEALCDSADALLFGINIDPANPASNPSAAEVHDLGARWVRMEWKADFGFPFYDEAIRRYRDAGIYVLLLVDYASVSVPKPAGHAPSWEWDAYAPHFVEAARAIAAHYGDGVDAYELWNEPDQPPDPYLDSYVPPSTFGPMLREASAAMRAHTSRWFVIGGLSSGDVGYWHSTIAAAGDLPEIRVIGTHPYGADWLPGSSLSWHYDSYLAASGRELWVTEIGIEDPAGQVDYMRHVYEQTRAHYAGRVGVVFWFAWSDHNRPGYPFGVVDESGARKPLFTAYQDAAPGSRHRCDPGAEPPPPEPEPPPPEPEPSPEPSCPCIGDNFCAHPPSTSGCEMTHPGGYCDPNGDGSYDDGDWVRGWAEHGERC